MKIAIITCYFDPDYVRSRSLRAAIAQIPDVETIIIKNKHKGMLRYPEVTLKLIKCRLLQKPDIYLLGFRGQEMLPITLFITHGRPLIFDELIVPLAWATMEGRRQTVKNRLFGVMARLSVPLYKRWLKKCRAIIADTKEHAKLSAELGGIEGSKYIVVPVSTDETLFKPPSETTKKSGPNFKVFYYGLKMTPLHGLKYILEAAIDISKQGLPIEFIIIGGDQTTKEAIDNANSQGAKISYQKHVPFDEFHGLIYDADLCLGGPFGDTPQARHVITGKTFQFIACAAPTIIGASESTKMFKSGYDSLVVSLGDSKALAEKIIWGYEHQDGLREIGGHGRELYEKEFSNKVVSHILERLLKQIAASPNNS
jgi:glycosyltransferase involved in cell wall biosynthesis